eukprot:TRINITY_DN5950_c0_g1_i4.p1 TRINITY_DN5950_c0_g1~~TRINITY_DN5950_c0_g1_i4.p1  ORF type:complete len:1360 (-),score=279.66 TRINITY_DN5950_c0_g1_i4:394-4473(-)
MASKKSVFSSPRAADAKRYQPMVTRSLDKPLPPIPKIGPSTEDGAMSTMMQMRNWASKMHISITRHVGLLEDFVAGNQTPASFVDALEKSSPKCLQHFFHDWCSLMGMFQSMHDILSMLTPRELDMDLTRTLKTWEQNAVTSVEEHKSIDMTSTQVPSIALGKTVNQDLEPTQDLSSLLITSRIVQPEPPHPHKPLTIGDGQPFQRTQSYNHSGRRISDADTTSNTPRQSLQRHASLRSKEPRPTESMKLGLVVLGAGYFETAEVLAPYVSNTQRKKANLKESSIVDEDDSKFMTPSRPQYPRPNLDERINQELKRHEDLLRVVLSLAFSTENKQAGSPESVECINTILKANSPLATSDLMGMWKHLSSNQQAKWMRTLLDQFVRINKAISFFEKIADEPSYRRAQSISIQALQELSAVKHVIITEVLETSTSGNQQLKPVSSSQTNFPVGLPKSVVGITGSVLAEAAPIFVQNVKEDPRYNADMDGVADSKDSLLAVPIVDRLTKKVTFIVLAYKDAFSEEDKVLTESLISQVGSILLQVKHRSQEVKLRKKLQALIEISRIISSELEISPLIEKMRRTSKDLLHADKCTLFLVNHQKGELWTKLEEGLEISFPLSSGIAGYVARSGDTVNIPDAYQDPRFRPDVDADTGYRTRSILCMPVRDIGGNIVAAIQMINKDSGHFGDEDEELLHAFCDHAAIAIRNSKLYEADSEERRKFRALSQIMDVISSELELDSLITILRLKSRELLEADRCTLFLLDEVRQEVRTKLAEGNEVSFPLSQGIAGYVIRTGETLNIKDAYQDERFNRLVDSETGYRTRNILCMPVRSSEDGAIVGAIQMVNKKGGPFVKADEELLKAFSAHAAVAITNSKLYHQISSTKRTLENILRSITSYVITFDMNGLLTSYNKPFEKLFGVDVSELQNEEFWSVLETDSNADMIGDMKKIYTSNSSLSRSQYKICSRRGDIFFINYTVSPLFEEDVQDAEVGAMKRKSGILLVIEDITSISSMRSMLKEMESRISQLTTHVTSTFEAPIQIVIRTIEQMTRGNIPLGTAKQELAKCVSLLTRSDLFRPDWDSMLHSMDEELKDWVMNRFADDMVIEFSADVSTPRWSDIAKITLPMHFELSSWEYDCMDLSEETLLGYAAKIFDHFNIPALFSIPEESMQNFLLAVKSKYHHNPFHNFHHAFYVLQACFVLLTKTQVTQYMTNTDIFALLVSALCHDLDHPGVSNSFEVNSKSPLALRYNDVSVQENHHASVCFTLMRDPANNILANLQPDEYKEFRKTTVASILATDMSQHFEVLMKFKNILLSEDFSRDSKEHRQLLVSILLHCSDLSNQVRPTSIATKWSQWLREEFLLQV